MATQAKIPMSMVRTIFGTPVPTLNVPEDSAAAFVKGALVHVAAGDGMLTECGADPALILGIATRTTTASGTDGLRSQLVHLAMPTCIAKGYIDTSAGEGTGTSAATDRLKCWEVAKSASGGIWYVDKAASAADRVVVWEFWESVENGVLQAIGDIRHHCLFSFLLANCQALIGNS